MSEDLFLSDLDLTADVAALPQGVPPNRDPRRANPVGILVAKDPTRNRVQVSVDGGSPQWLPALPGNYATGQTVWVFKNVVSGDHLLVLGPTLGYPAEVLGTLTALDTGTERGTVSIDNTTYVLPYVGGTYTVGGKVWVSLDPTLFGTPRLILGPAGTPPAQVQQPQPQQPPSQAQTVQRRTTILPEWSGSWRASQGRWNQWNVGTNGGDALWQGDRYGSGPMTGLATYGNHFTDLGALSIDKVLVTARGANQSSADYPTVVFQCATDGSQPAGAPTTTGADTASADPGRAGVDQATLTAGMCEALRTGTARGLALVGPGYAAIRGTSAPDGCACDVYYTTPA